jgi:hypothetical protein
MTTNPFSTLLAIILLAHGVGHMLWLVTLLGMADWRQTSESWLITPRFGCYVTQAVGVIVWLGAIGAFLAAAFGVFVAQDYWRTAAVIGAIISIIGLFLFWKNPPSQPFISALAFDLITLAALLIFEWPNSTLLGA